MLNPSSIQPAPDLAAVKQVFAPLPPMAAKVLAVLLTIAHRTPTHLLAEISIEKLTDLAGCSRRTSCSALAALKQAGFIVALPRHYLFPTTYIVQMPAALQPQPAPVQPAALISQTSTPRPLTPQPTVQPIAPISQNPPPRPTVQPAAPISHTSAPRTSVQPIPPISPNPSPQTTVQSAAPISLNPPPRPTVQPTAPISQTAPQTTAAHRAARRTVLQAAALRAIGNAFR